MKLLDRVFVGEDEEDRRIAEEDLAVGGPVRAAAPLAWYWTVGLIVVVALPRLIYIFAVSDPQKHDRFGREAPRGIRLPGSDDVEKPNRMESHSLGQ